MTENDTSKKSETIEVRVSYETKQALKDKCRSDGTTISSVMRRFIHQFLEAESDVSKRNSNWRKLMTFAAEKPRRAIVLGASAITLIAFGLAPIRAEDVSLQVTGSVLKRDGEYVNSTDIKTTLVAKYDDEVAIRFDHNNGTAYIITLTTTQAENNTVMITSEISIEQGEEKKTVAMPGLLARFDERARVEIGQQDADGRPLNISYELEILPTKL